jgi:2-polyprenyl-3-methyl-5-hydroxy-6-metoxy-1,4-benzoquinol methylase
LRSSADETSYYNEYQYADLVDRSKDPYAAAKYDVICRCLTGRRNLTILNAGCGSGELSFRLAAAGHRVLGIDPASEYIELAEKDGRRTDRCTFQVASIEAFEPRETFDCVVATDVIEHIADDRAAFNRLVDLVRPGGPVILTVPAMPSLFGFHDEALGHCRRYSKATLRELVAPRCTIDLIRYFGFSLIPVCLLYSKLLRRAYPVAEAGDSRKSPLFAPLVRFVLTLESRIPAPLGTSLICAGTSRSR